MYYYKCTVHSEPLDNDRYKKFDHSKIEGKEAELDLSYLCIGAPAFFRIVETDRFIRTSFVQDVIYKEKEIIVKTLNTKYTFTGVKHGVQDER